VTKPLSPRGLTRVLTPRYKESASSFQPCTVWSRMLGGRINMLWTICVILIILWLLGFGFHVGGGLIHTLLVVAVIVFVWNLLTSRRYSA
jgi:Family of unknown function (DUF5670)